MLWQYRAMADCTNIAAESRARIFVPAVTDIIAGERSIVSKLSAM